MRAAALTPGVYFDLHEDAYHADPALGSSNLRKLLASGPDYWWTSPLNPSRPAAEPSPALVFGKALHKLVLEGREAFDALYEREQVGDHILTTDVQVTTWLKSFDVMKLPRTKAEKIELMRETAALHGKPMPPVQDDIQRAAREAGRTILKQDDYDRILVAGALITKNPELATAFQGGASEVSVFWQHETGVMLKCRFDYLKPLGIGDLKSIRNSRGIPFVEACRRAIAEHRYDIQAAHYLAGRGHLRDLVADGLVFGDHDPAWLQRVADAEEFGFAWVFHQASDAPITWATSISPGNPILDVAAVSIRNAIETYRTFMRTFGADEMWVLSEPVNELDLSEMPGWWARAA